VGSRARGGADLGARDPSQRPGGSNDEDRHLLAHGRFAFLGQRACEPLRIHEERRRPPNFCSIGDPVERLRPLMHRGPNEPVNLDNDEELTVLEIAERVRELAGSRSELVFLPRPEDDPERRRPDFKIMRVRRWGPQVESTGGICLTVQWNLRGGDRR
jgi:nucleoside-diphosphate-sugar epimerase